MKLTRELMRSHIAAVLHEDEDQIGGADNLVDLGLDSLRAMSLTTRWSETGIELDFAELAEDLTLDAWWSIVKRQQERT